MSIQISRSFSPVACKCGSESWAIDSARPLHVVRCLTCGYVGPASGSQRGAIRAWNAENGPEPPTGTPGPASQAALDAVAHAVRVKLAAGGWKHGVDGMIVRLSKDQGEALLAEMGMAREDAK